SSKLLLAHFHTPSPNPPWPEGSRNGHTVCPPNTGANPMPKSKLTSPFQFVMLEDSQPMKTKKPAAAIERVEESLKATRPGSSQNGKIHPVVIYPFKQPGHYSDLEELYGLISRLAAEPETYARPITVMDRKTFY